MSKSIVKNRIAPSPGASVRKREHRQEGRCKNVQSKTRTENVVSDSLFALILKPKGGAEIFFQDRETKGNRIYPCLRGALDTAMRLTGKNPITFDANKFVSNAVAIDWVIKKFKEEIVPEGYKVGIDYDNRGENYKFVIFKMLESPEAWNLICIKDVAQRLEKKNKALYELFLEVLALMRSKNVSFWYDSPGFDWLEQEIFMFEEGEENMDQEVYEETKRCIEEYRGRHPNQIFRYIRERLLSGPIDVEGLIERLKWVRNNRKIAAALIDVCHFFSQPYSTNNFGYDPEDYEYSGLRYEDQTTVMWSAGDAFFNYTQEWLDTEAQEGILPPCIFLPISEKTESIDFAWMEQATDWPARLTDLFSNLSDVLS